MNASSSDILVVRKTMTALTIIVTKKLVMVRATPLEEAFRRVSRLIPRPLLKGDNNQCFPINIEAYCSNCFGVTIPKSGPRTRRLSSIRGHRVFFVAAGYAGKRMRQKVRGLLTQPNTLFTGGLLLHSSRVYSLAHSILFKHFQCFQCRLLFSEIGCEGLCF